MTYSKQIAIYKLKVEKINIKAYLEFISTNNNTLQGYLQVKILKYIQTQGKCSKEGLTHF